MEAIHLLILDECHHAVKKHPYSLVMSEFYHTTPKDRRPAVFGMTASPVCGLPSTVHTPEWGLSFPIKLQVSVQYLNLVHDQLFQCTRVESTVACMRASYSRVFSGHPTCSSQAKMPSHKTFKIKKKLAKKMRQKWLIPYWIHIRTDNTIRYNAKWRHWRRTKLGF
ncbi:hypothetical protein Taro_039516 [Colocasia esculenta]|uniref:Uncharacterized protein n=1 Tax=Colocasia esculenta TaxID=4460 RepID=A0A843WGU0_COLES|nr:hypothetical protein [Colocasia esculenta]